MRMKTKPEIVAQIGDPPAVGEAFSLYDTEEAVLVKTDGMLAGLAQVAGGVQHSPRPTAAAMTSSAAS